MFRKSLFWLHLAAGVVAGAVILIMSVTGALLTFQQSVLRYVERAERRVEVPAGAARLTADALLARIGEQRPDAEVTGLTFDADPGSAVTISLGTASVFANPYTGEITGSGSAGARAFYRSVTNWHRWLAREGEARTTARAITGACNAAFLILALTGVYLWMPRRWTWRHVSPVVWFRGGLTGKAREFNWHNVIGLWCAPVIVVLTATGMVISYPWASNLVYTLTGSPVPAGRGGGPGSRGGGPSAEARSGPGRAERGDGGPRQRAGQASAAAAASAPLEQLLETARRHVPTWSTLALRLAPEGSGPVTISLTDGAHWNAFARSSLTLNRASGAVIRWEPYDASSRGQKLRGWMRFAHTGELGGLPGELVAGLASVGGAFLVYTGMALSLRRLAAWRARTSGARARPSSAERAA